MQGQFKDRAKTPHDFETAWLLLYSEDYAGAYLIFSSLSENDDVASKFNHALCLMKINEYQPALNLLEAALSIIKKMPPSDAPADATYRKLVSYSEERYLSPMPQRMPQSMPWLAKENIQRLMIDVLFECEQFDRVKQLATGLHQFENVKLVIEKIKNINCT